MAFDRCVVEYQVRRIQDNLARGTVDLDIDCNVAVKSIAGEIRRQTHPVMFGYCQIR